MPIIPLEQGSDAWKKYRQGRIMATDASVISGSNDFSSPLELWEEKLCLRAPRDINKAMLRGQELEPVARTLFCEMMGYDFDPVVYESDSHVWAAASLDGLCSSTRNLLEIKCPKEKTHVEALQGVIPAYYRDQMQWQLFVTRYDCCFYFSYRPEYKANPFAIMEVKPDLERQEILLNACYDFYTNLCSVSPPLPWILGKSEK